MSNKCLIYKIISTSNKYQTTENKLRELKPIAELKRLTIFDTLTDE